MDSYEFKEARPVWADGREREMNCELAFRAVLPAGEIELALAASSVYRLWINGKFICAGPARTAHGFYSVDTLQLEGSLTEEENVAVVEVVGYNVNSFDTLDQPAFLTAEFTRAGALVAYTGGNDIRIYDMGRRVERVQRYSFQRAFAEDYRLREADNGFYTQISAKPWADREEACRVQPEKRYVRRSARMPEYECLPVRSMVEKGRAEFRPARRVDPFPWERKSPREAWKAYGYDEMEEHLPEEAAGILLGPGAPGGETFPCPLSDGYALYELPFDASGFLRFQMQCQAPCTVYLFFDEIRKEGKLDFLRMGTCNCFKYALDAGSHSVMTFAPYTMKYVQIAVKGSAVLEKLEMVEYKHPSVPRRVRLPEDKELEEIYQAALESYRSNAVDLFMDCPSRERAGWLCDSFFTARVEHVLTGECVLERAFLENFLLPERFSHLPEGMLPMCYPADHYDGKFIPNWAMWYVLELEEYLERSGDRELVDRARERVLGLAEYFRSFENEDGLLEKLEGWIFLEWSRANEADVVQDINFPTNMLYVRMLDAVASLYGQDTLREKASRLRQVIRERSFNGTFYTDNERRTEDGLWNPGNCTEVCQYYAFFTGVATKEEDATLWEILLRDFGPRRRETELHPDVAFANAFIGNYLRVELLYRDGCFEEVVRDIRGYFAKMPKLTGTLWENDTPYASCNHGFASHVIYWLAGIYGLE